MRRISLKIFLFLNALTYGFIAIYVLINYIFLENYQIRLKKRELTSLSEQYNGNNTDELSEQNGIFMREVSINKDKKNSKIHSLKFIEDSLWEDLQSGKAVIDVQTGRDNIRRIILAKKLDKKNLLIVATSIAPISDVIKSTLKFFIYIIFLSIPINLYIAYVFSIKKENIDLKETLENILKRYSMDLKLNNINLNLNLENITLLSDKKLLERCLNNLIINSLAYVNEKKNIDIFLDSNAITIKNSSHSLNNENIDEYFKPFSKKNDKKVRKYGGTGLGLSVVSEILKNLSLNYKLYYDEVDEFVVFKIFLKPIKKGE